MNGAIGLTKGMTNRQIGQEMFVAEKTVKHLTSSVLRKLGMARRAEAAVFITRALNSSEEHSYRSSPFPDLIEDVTATLLDCISESATVPPTDEERARDALRLADALAAAQSGRTGPRLLPETRVAANGVAGSGTQESWRFSL